METTTIPAPETDETREAKRQLYELQQRYQREAEPYVRILSDHAAKSRQIVTLSKEEALAASPWLKEIAEKA